MPVTVAYCTGSIAELSRTYIEDKRNRNANAKACLAKALEGTRWAVGTVETGTITGTANLSFYHCTALDAIQKIADTYGLEVQTEYQPDPTATRSAGASSTSSNTGAPPTPRNASNTAKTSPKSNATSTAATSSPASTGGGKGIEQTNEEGEATGGYSRKISFADVNNGETLRPRRPSARQLGHRGSRRHQTPQRSRRGLPRLRRPQGTPKPHQSGAQNPHHARRLLHRRRDRPRTSRLRPGRHGRRRQRADHRHQLHHTIAPRRPHPPDRGRPCRQPRRHQDHPRQHPAILHAAPRRPNSRRSTNSSPTPAHGTAPPAAPART